MATGRSADGKTYTIESLKGTSFLMDASPGSTMTGGDGSTWTKNNDGSTTISKNGTTYTVGGGGTSTTNSGTGAIANLAQRAVNVLDTARENYAEQQAQLEYQRQLEAQRLAEEQKQRELEEYLREQYRANTEKALSGLRGAYERGLAGYNAQAESLGGVYDAARNRAAAQTALERMNFNERAAASGLNSGTSGQAELARSAVQQSTLAGIDKAQSDALSQIDLAKNQLAASYEQAAAETQANYDSQLAQDLYQEMLRQQAQSEAALEQRLAEAQAAAQPTKPTLTAAQTLQALKSGVVNDATKAAYEYYYGQPYDAGTQTSTVVSPVYTPKVGYNNGTLDPEQVRQLQALLGVDQDGYWGPATQAAANAMWGTTDADTAYRTAGGRTVNPSTLESGANYSSVLADIQQLRANGAGSQTINSVISAALNAGTITAAQAAMLRSSYVGSGR